MLTMNEETSQLQKTIANNTLNDQELQIPGTS